MRLALSMSTMSMCYISQNIGQILQFLTMSLKLHNAQDSIAWVPIYPKTTEILVSAT